MIEPDRPDMRVNLAERSGKAGRLGGREGRKPAKAIAPRATSRCFRPASIAETRSFVASATPAAITTMLATKFEPNRVGAVCRAKHPAMLAASASA